MYTEIRHFPLIRTFPRENTRWEEEEIVVCVQVLTTCSGKQWWCPNCKVGLSVCIEAFETIISSKVAL
jgi:hypothetical protein